MTQSFYIILSDKKGEDVPENLEENMNRFWAGLGGKLLFIGLIVGSLMIASLVVRSKVEDRSNVYDSACRDIQYSAGYNYSFEGPYIDIPVVHTWYEEALVKEKVQKVKKQSTSIVTLNPKNLSVLADIKTQKRTVGIYSSPVFTGSLKIDCVFDVEYKSNSEYEYKFNDAVVYIKSSTKNLLETPDFTINGKKTESSISALIQDSGASKYKQYNSDYLIALCSVEGNSVSFSTEIAFRGAESFSVKPIAKNNNLKVNCDWPSPGFTNFAYLPTERTLTSEGFTAEWNVPLGSSDSGEIGFTYKEPIYLYRMLDRATNYAFLFVIIPFIVLFLFELLKNIRLHPLNYLLSGVAVILFFLLLLSLSEHIPFGISYLISAFAAGILVTVYIGAVTKKLGMVLAMAFSFALLYGYLYVALQSEDNALLIGSIFLFLILAAVMFVTRKVKWPSAEKKVRDGGTGSTKILEEKK